MRMVHPARSHARSPRRSLVRRHRARARRRRRHVPLPPHEDAALRGRGRQAQGDRARRLRGRGRHRRGDHAVGPLPRAGRVSRRQGRAVPLHAEGRGLQRLRPGRDPRQHHARHDAGYAGDDHDRRGVHARRVRAAALHRRGPGRRLGGRGDLAAFDHDASRPASRCAFGRVRTSTLTNRQFIIF